MPSERSARKRSPSCTCSRKSGFEYKNQVDPFDGGPHLWANVDELLPVKKLATYVLTATNTARENATRDSGLICPATQVPGQFRAVAVQTVIENGKIWIMQPDLEKVTAVLGVSIGDPVVFMPYY